MKHLHCTHCKFTLPVTPDEASTYKAAIPMHCGHEMVPDGAGKPVEETKPVEAPVEKEEKKKGKKKK
jgi:hypothetical protein